MATRRHSLLAANRRNMGLFDEARSATEGFNDPVIQRRKMFKQIGDTGKEIFGGWKSIQGAATGHLDKKAKEAGFDSWKDWKEDESLQTPDYQNIEFDSTRIYNPTLYEGDTIDSGGNYTSGRNLNITDIPWEDMDSFTSVSRNTGVDIKGISNYVSFIMTDESGDYVLPNSYYDSLGGQTGRAQGPGAIVTSTGQTIYR